MDETTKRTKLPTLVWKPFHLRHAGSPDPRIDDALAIEVGPRVVAWIKRDDRAPRPRPTPEYLAAEWWARVRTWDMSPKAPAEPRQRRTTWDYELKKYLRRRRRLAKRRSELYAKLRKTGKLTKVE